MAIGCVLLVGAGALIPKVIPIQVVFCIPVTALYVIIAAIVITIKRSHAFKPVERNHALTAIH